MSAISDRFAEKPEFGDGIWEKKKTFYAWHSSWPARRDTGADGVADERQTAFF
jgi:hypothetical protein